MKGIRGFRVNKKCVVLNGLELKGNSTVQLFSRVTGKPLQILKDDLSVDANGSTIDDAMNTYWNVHFIDDLDYDGMYVQLFNEDYQLAIIDGKTQIISSSESEKTANEAIFKLGISDRFIQLQSSDENGHHVGVNSDGTLKAAMVTGVELGSQFAPKVISNSDESILISEVSIKKSASDTELFVQDDIEFDCTNSIETKPVKVAQTLPRNVDSLISNERRSFAQMRNSFRNFLKK